MFLLITCEIYTVGRISFIEAAVFVAAGLAGATTLLAIRRLLPAAGDRAGTGKPATELEAGAPKDARENLLADIARDLDRETPALLGLVRFCDVGRMAAFDRPSSDRIFQELAHRLRSAVRDDLAPVRVGPDCFAIWFRATPVEEATNELRAIAYVLEGEIALGERRIAPEIALSAAVHPRDAEGADALLAGALAALPEQRPHGASQVVFFSPASSDVARRRLQLEQDLRRAISRDQLHLHYQPVADLALGRIVGAEALIRWRHPELGWVSPVEFVPILEQSSLIDEVGLWVLNTACREARSWREHGLGELKVAVNLSPHQVRATLPLTIARTLERHRLTSQRLEVELTETAAMQDAAGTREVLEQLKALGLGVALDDFGAGYSSLNYLKNLPFSKLKIDREFVVKVHERPDSQAICSALIALAKGLGIEILAEGVEERAEVEALLGLGCPKFQGYFFSRPLPPAQFVGIASDPDWLAKLGFGAEGTASQAAEAYEAARA